MSNISYRVAQNIVIPTYNVNMTLYVRKNDGSFVYL